jgi:ribosome-associated protein
MDIRKLQRAIVDGLEDVKAQDIQVFNTEHLSALFERVIVASGTSNRQTKALAASVRDSVKSRGLPVMRTEGEDNGEWIIVDCGAAVAHIMQPAIREYYHLEELWGGKAVKMKYGEAKLGLVKAAEPESVPKRAPASTGKSAGSKPASRKPSAVRSPAKPAAARKPATGKPAAKSTSAQRPAAKKAPAKRPAATASRAAPKPAPRAAAPKPAGRSTASKTGVSKKTAGAKTSASRPAAKKPTRRA